MKLSSVCDYDAAVRQLTKQYINNNKKNLNLSNKCLYHEDLLCGRAFVRGYKEKTKAPNIRKLTSKNVYDNLIDAIKQAKIYIEDSEKGNEI